MSDDRGIKVILLGEAGVGKTNLIHAALGGKFNPNSCTTITNEFYDSVVSFNNKNYAYFIWDTAGQEAYRAINKIFIKDSKIIFLVFSIDSKKSFEEIDFWINYVNEILGKGDHIIILIGNKSDLFLNQEVEDEDIKKKAEELKIRMKITSALKDGEGFKNYLEEILKEYILKHNTKEIEKPKETFTLDQEKIENNNDGTNKNKKTKKKCPCFKF